MRLCCIVGAIMHIFVSLFIVLFMTGSGLLNSAYAELSVRDSQIESPSLSGPVVADDNWLLRLSYNWNQEKEYLPAFQRYLYRWNEQTLQLQAGRDLQNNSHLAVGVVRGEIRQYSLIYQDYDFQLRRQGIYLLYQTDISSVISSDVQLRYESFERNGSGFYQLGDNDDLLTGYARVSWHGQNNRLDFNYVRERDPDPVYDFNSGRAALNIEAQTLTGISWGHAHTRQLESVISLYYESYGSLRPNQWNPNLQLIWQALPQLGLALGSGYFTEEEEFITNLTVNWQRRLTERVQLEVEYQLEHASEEKSLLHQGQVLFLTSLNRQWYWLVQLTAGQETLDDEDRFFSAISSLSFQF